jgi:membrane protease YdiL (CAAX protease family)
MDTIIAKNPIFLNQKINGFSLTNNFIYVFILKGIFNFLSWRFILNRLVSWLRTEPVGIELYSFLIMTTMVYTIISTILGITSYYLGFVDENQRRVETFLTEVPLMTIFVTFFIGIVKEEVIFRLPLALFIKLKAGLPAILTVSVVSSILFGYYHGDWVNLKHQSVGGLVYCIVFLKCGGLHGNYKKAFLSALAVHLLYDLFGVVHYFIFS